MQGEGEVENGDAISEGRPAQSGDFRDRRAHFLAGEDPGADDLQDVEHWIRVYTELVTTTHDLQLTARAEADRLNDQVRWLKGRLEFWMKRREGLTSAPAAADEAALEGDG